jgi:hypothetical protein
MKKLLVLTAVVVLIASTVGCQCRWWRRGALFPGLAPGVTVVEPCPPANPCDPCAPGSYTTTPSTPLPGPMPTLPTE